MDPVGVNVIETAALGRPFQLGMLYDCRKDALIPGITLWDPEKLQQSLRVRPQINTYFKVTASDSIQDKSNLMNIDGSLKLSVLGGLVSVSGTAKYLNDTKKSFRQQRLTLHYHSTCRYEELTMNRVVPENIVHREVLDNDTATHVVTAVLYGADACFVFDREVSSDEKLNTVEGEAKVALEKLKFISVDANINLKMNDTQKNAVQKFTCTFYGDFQLPSNPTSFEDALKVFSDLPKLLGEKKELAVPLRVWLYPLDKLLSRASKLQKDISMDLILDTESVIESLNTTEMKCSDLACLPASTFAEFQDKILQMKQNCYRYKLRLMKKLGSLLPNIRGDVMKETDLNDLLQDHNESPFSEGDLAEWLKERERESDVIKSVLRQLKDAGAQVEDNIDLLLMELELGNLVSYTFTSLNWSDVLLLQQTTYLSNSTKGETDENGPDSEQKSWLTPEMQKTLRSNLKIFKNLIDSKDREPAKFIVSSKEMKNNPGCCILLYESECDEAVCFIPPSKPACPITEEVKDNSVVLKVPPSCSSTVELRLLYKRKQDRVWTSKPVMKDENTVTLTDLRAGTEYEIKCAALGILNYTVYSDVISVTTESLKTQKPREDLFQSLSMKTKKSDSTDKRRRHCGLENQGSSSCLNAVLQTLFMTKEFRQHVKSVSSDDNFIRELKKLFKELETQEKNAVSTTEIMKSLGITDVYKQDAAVLLRLILKKTPGSSELFKGTKKMTRTCRSCRDKPEQISEDFLSLIVSIQNSQDVEDVLQAYACGNKTVGSVYCDHCRKMIVIESKTEMNEFPEHPIVELKRSEFSYSTYWSSFSKNEVIIHPHIKSLFAFQVLHQNDS
ncbi:verrucotoxin subunit beta-like isoform X8 [Ctenopharyngodon idella]|uniref:verrucotoxin subunit beta-like isoform X8 n=1 Tax=Ctenopharyngodon idella TaxID=7959 RepID=UPI0022318EE2|nr:verrucotoxin subunit beta-like isoform X8 [Ctenopharyngodon idella]